MPEPAAPLARTLAELLAAARPAGACRRRARQVRGASWSGWRSTASRTCSSTSTWPRLDDAGLGQPARRAAGAVGARASWTGCRTASTSRSSAAAPGGGPGAGPSGGCAVLMHDVAPWLVPVTDEPIPLGQHERFLAHMAALHAAFWDCGPEVDVVPVMHRYLELSPWMAEAEAAVGLRSPGAAAGRQGLAAAGRGRAGRRRGRRPAGARSGPAGRGAGQHAADVRAQQLEAGQPRHRRRRAGRSCWTGSSPGAARRSATWPGTWPSTAAACRSPRRTSIAGVPGGAGGVRRSTPGPGGTASWR